MNHVLVESAWWLFVTQINAAAWLSISGEILIWWLNFDLFRRLF